MPLRDVKIIRVSNKLTGYDRHRSNIKSYRTIGLYILSHNSNEIEIYIPDVDQTLLRFTDVHFRLLNLS